MFNYEKEVPKNLLVAEYDHVHHAQIVYLLEEGRLRLLESVGYPQDELIKKGIFIVITGLSVRFLREVRGTRISITCENIEIDGRTIRMTQRLINLEKGKDLVLADIELMILDKTIGRAVVVPPYLAEALVSNSN